MDLVFDAGTALAVGSAVVIVVAGPLVAYVAKQWDRAYERLRRDVDRLEATAAADRERLSVHEAKVLQQLEGLHAGLDEVKAILRGQS